eukprot:TRINITY_DN3683_c0_g1_i2.p1 TRINITY_DN3683_c0_g1~~TRINITY_DN3683_c0_g1_i2.p1  ORF type:complete len:303 (-),score=57.82 TRINITY_DN3683_c0_g1_i2:291-1166(-)
MSGLRLDVEDWYPFLEPETFATTIIPLTYREAQAVLHAADDVKFKVNDHLTGEDKEVLAALALKLDAGLTTWKSSGAFVRLSKRSPKDAALRDPRLKQYIAAEMEAEPDDAQTPASKGKGHVAQADIGKAIIAITRAVTKLACIHSGTEAIDMLVRSQRRIYPDLTLLLLQQSEAEFNENIILREFVDLRPEMEFRAFIHQGQMTGLTQYNSLCYVPEVAGNHEALGKSILAYWDTRVRPLVPPTIPSYVCDFAFVKTPEGEVLKTIELNPFGECTHACLFDWKVCTQFSL